MAGKSYGITPPDWQPNESDLRSDGTKKGRGFLGVIPITYPDGKTGVASEYSVGVNLGGKDLDIPTLIPTLTPEEIKTMTTDIIPQHKSVPDQILKKAVEHAKDRIGKGISPYVD